MNTEVQSNPREYMHHRLMAEASGPHHHFRIRVGHKNRCIIGVCEDPPPDCIFASRLCTSWLKLLHSKTHNIGN